MSNIGDTGEFRRLIHTEIGEAINNAAMRLEAIRVNALMADLREMTYRVQSYQAVLADIVELLQRGRAIVDSAIEERGDDQILAEVALLMESVQNLARGLMADG